MTVPLLQILGDSPLGLTVADRRVAPHSGAFTPEAIMCHHTATRSAGLGVVQHGRPGLAGPLANLNLARNGTWNVVTEGLAWHAGAGSSKVLAEARLGTAPSGDAKARHLADDMTGNRWFVGIEVDNDGVGEPYPAAQLEALAKGLAALCAHFGWSEARVVHHREWTARKIDMSYRGPLRAAVASWLAHQPEPPEPVEHYHQEAEAMDRHAIKRPEDTEGHETWDVTAQANGAKLGDAGHEAIVHSFLYVLAPATDAKVDIYWDDHVDQDVAVPVIVPFRTKSGGASYAAVVDTGDVGITVYVEQIVLPKTG